MSVLAEESVEDDDPGMGLIHRTWCQRLGKYILDPRRIIHRFFLHFLLCMFAPGVLSHEAMFATFEGPLLTWLSIDHKDFGLLYSLPTLAGIVSAPTAGLVLRFGTTRLIVCSGALVFLGCIVVGYAVQRQSYQILLAGRVLFSLFQSVLGSVASLVTFRLFKAEASRALAYSLIIFSNRIGAISGFFFSGRILSLVGDRVSDAVWLSILPTAVAFFTTLSFAYLYRGTQIARLVRPLLQPSSRRQPSLENSPGEGLHVGMIGRMPGSFWTLWFLIGCVYGCILPFETIAVNFLQEEYGLDPTTAGSVLSLCPAFALLSPIFSSVIYSAGRQVVCAVIATVCITTAMFAMTLEIQWSPAAFMLLLGMGYMMATNVVWVLVPQIIPEEGSLQTLAIGVSGVSSSLFIAGVNFVAGYLRDISGSYQLTLVMFTVLGFAGFACSLKLAIDYWVGLWGSRVPRLHVHAEMGDREVRVQLLAEGGMVEQHFNAVSTKAQ